MTKSNPPDLRKFEALLRIQRDQVRSEVVAQLHRSDDPDALTLANHIADGGDWTEADVENDTDIELLHQKLKRLSEIETALARFKDGSYGTCGSCGEAIPEARLEAQVTSEYCIGCQEDLEKKSGVRHANSI